MDSPLPPRGRKRRTSNSQIRKMVRNLVSKMENLQDELVVVISDIKDLVGQIDDVSTKIDKFWGRKLGKDEENNSRSNREQGGQTQNHNYVNVDLIPTIQGIENKINSKLYSKQCINIGVKRDVQIPSTSAGTDKSSVPNRISRKLPITKLKSQPNVIQQPVNFVDPVELPMTELSNMGINQTGDTRSKLDRSDSFPKTLKSLNFYFTYPQPNNQECLGQTHTPTAVCYAELKRHYFSNRSPSSCTSDIILNEKTSTPITGTTIRSLTSSSLFSNVSPDVDLYERRLDDDLENIPEISDGSVIETDDSIETINNSNWERYSENNADIRYEVNTWTSFSLNQFSESTRSSESFVSDTSSDNDNIWPPSNVGDIFSSSMLARKLNLHLGNGIAH